MRQYHIVDGYAGDTPQWFIANEQMRLVHSQGHTTQSIRRHLVLDFLPRWFYVSLTDYYDYLRSHLGSRGPQTWSNCIETWSAPLLLINLYRMVCVLSSFLLELVFLFKMSSSTCPICVLCPFRTPWSACGWFKTRRAWCSPHFFHNKLIRLCPKRCFLSISNVSGFSR